MPGVTGKSFVNVVLALVSVAVCACGNSSAPGSADVGRGNLTAAGATFPEPFYSRAFFAYSQSYPQVTVNYQAVGSGAGIEQFIKGVRGTGGDCKRCFFRKTLWFWGEDGECIEGLPCQRCQEVVRDGNDRLKRNWYRARNTGMGFRLNMWLANLQAHLNIIELF